MPDSMGGRLMGKTYAERLKSEKQAYLSIGINFGTQRMADYIAVALNDPQIMGGSALGAKRIKKVFEAVRELELTLGAAFYANAEQDYWQEIMDRQLKQIFGKDFSPFRTRYPMMKEIRYDR